MTRSSFDQSDPHHRPRAERGASRLQGRLLILAISLFAAGCDTFTFNPPRPPELATKSATPRASTGGTGAVSTSAKTVEVVLTPRLEADVESFKSTVRLQAGMDKIRFVLTAPPEGAPASEQAELVRKAVARNPLALVIEAPKAPDSALIEAAAEARKAGIPVVAVGYPLNGPEPSAAASDSDRPIVVVTHRDLKPSAAVLVADAQRAAKNGKIATDTGAVILLDHSVDALVQVRVDAIRDALKAAGVKKVEELSYVRTVKDGEKRLVEYLKAHPETTLVFAVDAGGMIAADVVTGVLKTDHPFVIAGYSDSDAARNQVLMGEYAAVGVLSFDRLLRKGVSVAAGVLKGSNVSERVEIEVPLLEAGATAALPRVRVLPPEKPTHLRKAASTEN